MKMHSAKNHSTQDFTSTNKNAQNMNWGLNAIL